MLRYTYRPQRTDPPRSQLQQPQPQKEAPVSQIRDTVDDNINPALPFARSTMGIMVYSLLLRVMQDLYHQQYNLNYPLCKQSCRGSKWVSTHSCTNSRGPTRLLEGLYPAYLQSHDGLNFPHSPYPSGRNTHRSLDLALPLLAQLLSTTRCANMLYNALNYYLLSILITIVGFFVIVTIIVIIVSIYCYY